MNEYSDKCRCSYEPSEEELDLVDIFGKGYGESLSNLYEERYSLGETNCRDGINPRALVRAKIIIES